MVLRSTAKSATNTELKTSLPLIYRPPPGEQVLAGVSLITTLLSVEQTQSNEEVRENNKRIKSSQATSFNRCRIQSLTLPILTH